MICRDKVEELKKREELLEDYDKIRYCIRARTELLCKIDGVNDFPKYSYFIPNETNGLSILSSNRQVMLSGQTSIDDAVNLYDDIATRTIMIYRNHLYVQEIYREMYRFLGMEDRSDGDIKTNNVRDDYTHNIAYGTWCSVMLESRSLGIPYDDNFEDIVLSNSLMSMYDICAITPHKKMIFSVEERVVSSLDNFVIVPKHIDNGMVASYCS